jgi:hypothetical protein
MNSWPRILVATVCFLAVSTSVHASDYPLDIKLVWSIGDRGTTISVAYELNSADEGVLKVDEKTNAGFLLSQGFARLPNDEIARVSRAEKVANIWSLPKSIPSSDVIQKGANGIDTVLICYSSMTLSEAREATRVTINRECPTDKDSQRAVAFGRDLIRMAQKHFPDIASLDIWQEELNNKISED